MRKKTDYVDITERPTTRSTLSISMADREKLLKMVEEEAKRIFESGNVSATQQDTIKNAVKRTLDASLVDDE